MVSIAAALMTVLSFLPVLVGAIIIVVVGWILADIVAKLVTRLLERVGFEKAAQRTGVTGFIARSGAHGLTAARVVGELVKWFIRLIFLEAAASAIHLTAVTDIINRIVLFIPNLIVALVVLMIGALIAGFVADLVRGSAGEMGFRNPNLLATVARVAIIAFAVIVAMNQIGIAATLVNTLFMAVVFALALAVGLAFGLGGRDTASRMWERWYARGQEMAPHLETAAETSTQRAEAPVERRIGAPVVAGTVPERRRTDQPGRFRPTTE